MNKGLGAFLLGLLAVVGSAAFIALLIKKKLAREQDIDFDEFDDVVDNDEDYESFFNDDDDNEETADEPDESTVENTTDEEAESTSIEEEEKL